MQREVPSQQLHFSFSKTSALVPSASRNKQVALLHVITITATRESLWRVIFVLCVGSVLGQFQGCLLLWLGWHLSLLTINDTLEVMSGFEVSLCWRSQRERGQSWLHYREGEFLSLGSAQGPPQVVMCSCSGYEIQGAELTKYSPLVASLFPRCCQCFLKPQGRARRWSDGQN